jgi:hypothetical protein
MRSARKHTRNEESRSNEVQTNEQIHEPMKMKRYQNPVVE